MRAARAQGRLRGKQPKLSPRQEKPLASLHREGEHSITELADLFDVGRFTVQGDRRLPVPVATERLPRAGLSVTRAD